MGKLGSRITNLSSVFNLGTMAMYKLGQVIGNSITSAMEMVETVNLFSVAMGSLAVTTNNTLTSISALSGLDLTNMQKFSWYIQLIGKVNGDG